MPVTQLAASSLQELVGHVLQAAGSLPQDRFLWFRGSPCANLPLIPKIMRENKTATQVFERELRLLTRFRQRSMPYWPAGYPQNDWEHLFAMQHYGLPTRLLDWTENAFVAAHFALSTSPHHDHGGGPCVPTVWCLDPIGWNRATPVLSEFGDDIHVLTTADDEAEPYRPETDRKRQSTPVAIFGAHNSMRIVAQRGTFVVWGKETRPLEQFADDFGGSILWKIALTGERSVLFDNLHSLGFSETMVFPELQSLADELSRVEGWH